MIQTLLTQPRHWAATFRRHAPEYQFWGYEIGNVLAALAGVGGLAVLSGVWPFTSGPHIGVDYGSLWQLLTRVPELLATLGIIALVLGTWLARLVVRPAVLANGWGLRIDFALMRLSLLLAAACALWGASWITIAAVSFASGSALIRLTYHSGRFLKSGALMLILGGICLAIFGALVQPLGLVGFVLVLNGFYVAVAGVLAFQSGMMLTAPQERPTWRPLRRFERAMDWIADHLARPAVFWLPKEVKQNRPLYASMWARLPWRVALALSVTLLPTEGSTALVLASLCWVLGDIAFGSMDRPGT